MGQLPVNMVQRQRIPARMNQVLGVRGVLLATLSFICSLRSYLDILAIAPANDHQLESRTRPVG